VEEVYKKMSTGVDLVIRNWEEWVEFCKEHDEDPYEICDCSFDKGGGNTFDVEYIGDVPEREEE